MCCAQPPARSPRTRLRQPLGNLPDSLKYFASLPSSQSQSSVTPGWERGLPRCAQSLQGGLESEPTQQPCITPGCCRPRGSQEQPWPVGLLLSFLPSSTFFLQIYYCIFNVFTFPIWIQPPLPEQSLRGRGRGGKEC